MNLGPIEFHEAYTNLLNDEPTNYFWIILVIAIVLILIAAIFLKRFKKNKTLDNKDIALHELFKLQNEVSSSDFNIHNAAKIYSDSIKILKNYFAQKFNSNANALSDNEFFDTYLTYDLKNLKQHLQETKFAQKKIEKEIVQTDLNLIINYIQFSSNNVSDLAYPLTPTLEGTKISTDRTADKEK